MKSLLALFLVIVSTGVMANHAPKDALLINLPKNAELKFNADFIVASIESRVGTPFQSYIETARIDLKGQDREAVWSRFKYAAVIKRLKSLKHFEDLQRVLCFVDFNAKLSEDVMILKNASFKFKTPDTYGTPSEKYTKIGERILLDTEHNSEVSANFEGPLMRRLYCSFEAGPKFGWGTDFVSDMKISHLEALLAPYFELKY